MSVVLGEVKCTLLTAMCHFKGMCQTITYILGLGGFLKAKYLGDRVSKTRFAASCVS